MPTRSMAASLDLQSQQAPLPMPATLDDFDSVVSLYQPRIFRFLLASTRDQDLAQTLTQDTFLRAWVGRESFRGESSLATWLTRIALNLLRDHTRTERFRFWKRAESTAVEHTAVAGSVAYPGSSIEARAIAGEQVALIWETVSKLSERQRSVFLLRFLDDLSLVEISEATGMPVSTVKSHLYRALAAVRKANPAAVPGGFIQDPEDHA